MPTRPTQGGSSGTWGTELNAWLDVSLNSDGTLKSAAVAAAGGAAATKAVAQTAHGLSVGNAIRYNGSAYVKSKADAASNADVVGIVSAVADANNFTVQSAGFISGLSGLTAGTTYFLDPATAGALTGTEPTTATQVWKPLLLAVSTTTGFIINTGIGLVLPAAAQFRIVVKVLDDATALTSGDGKFIHVITSDLDGLNLVGVVATVTTVSSSGLPTMQIRNVTDSVDMLSTAVSIDASEFTSETAATPAVVDGAHDDVATGDLIAIDCDVAGTGAKGLTVSLVFA